MALAEDLNHTPGPSLEQSLHSALNAIATPVSISAATDLLRGGTGKSSITLHLRDAQITAPGAVLLATALGRLSESESARLHSFSLSYNDIGDDGAIALATSLPDSLYELGLVGCGIGDAGAAAMRQWALQAQGLRMICIENNPMSASARKSFMDLRQKSKALSVYV